MALLSIADIRVRKGAQPTAFELRVDRLEVEAYAKLALVGPSGCGKSTLLDLLALILVPDEIGVFRFTLQTERMMDIAQLLRARDLDGLGNFRRQHLGYVLQTGGLLPFVTVRRNIALPLQLLGLPLDFSVQEIATQLGIESHLDKYPSELSCGERQRVAIARALVHKPQLVLADEPTAALDPVRADDVMQLFITHVERIGSALVMATHDLERVARFGFTALKHEFVGDAPLGLTTSRFMQ